MACRLFHFSTRQSVVILPEWYTDQDTRKLYLISSEIRFTTGFYRLTDLTELDIQKGNQRGSGAIAQPV